MCLRLLLPQFVILTEDATTSSSRIFLKTLFQDLSEIMGLIALNKRLQDPSLAQFFDGIFPKVHAFLQPINYELRMLGQSIYLAVFCALHKRVPLAPLHALSRTCTHAACSQPHCGDAVAHSVCLRAHADVASGIAPHLPSHSAWRQDVVPCACSIRYEIIARSSSCDGTLHWIPRLA